MKYIFRQKINGYQYYNTQYRQHAFALFTTLIIVIIVGIVAVSSLRLTELTEVLSGNSIQRSRAFQSAESALIEGENTVSSLVQNRAFSSSDATGGVFSRNTVAEQWWQEDSYMGAQVSDTIDYLGVVASPSYVVEEVGTYISDDGTGIVSLDRGGGGYGRKTSSDREIVLFRLQSYGVGSTTTARAVIESLYVESK